MIALAAERGRDSVQEGPPQFFHGTLTPLAPGTTLGAPSVVATVAESRLEAGRLTGAGLRSAAIWAARSLRDATAIVAIRAYSPSTATPHEAIRVYRVGLNPFHVGPLAAIEEIERRLESRQDKGAEALVREYWEPTGVWYIQEVLARSLTILEEVPATSERDLYVRRWVQYNQDRERAEGL